MENIILQGDALKKLKELPEKSINMCMTSPPYWALRNYGDATSGTIWGGDKNCEHNFNIVENKNPTDRGGKSQYDNGKYGDWENTTKKTSSGFCNKCGAWKGQLGLEPTFDKYISNLCDIFDGVKRVLRDDGTCWVNIGDTYMNNSSYSEKGRQGYGNDKIGMINKSDSNVKTKSLTMIPMRFAIEMVNRGWILRNTIIWHKPNAMPCSATDRFTVDFEYIFLFSKQKKYYFETQREPHLWADKDKRSKVLGGVESKGKSASGNYATNKVCYHPDGRTKRTVWSINTKANKDAHFATYSEELCETPIKAGCPEGGIVLDPFFGSGTTLVEALKQNKKFIGIELNKEYIEIATKRLKPFLEQTHLACSTTQKETNE